ncbi:PREDICTED: calcitonin gene-related peptide type 1 receptor-like [Priapulus caudatus]|uniref:Calcitonin gene-related peptide type 1 receptor-like n=1 Tax=Priapulus caudatus TaxID=37621 RepID=A0ABM1DVZ0_PRICU|nr:PREDICTED: calcitonin gene-related peptide type 1 receptor-like [Priapulus caudatus]
MAGYSSSLVFIIISLLIFGYFKQLQCARVTVHKNLFTSYLLTNTVWIVWYATIVTNADVLRENKAWCQILHVLTQYLLACNYFWMFCEGAYLHTMIVITFVREETIMKFLYAIGWGTFISICESQLQCARVTVHKNLFTSYLLTNTVWIVWYATIVTNADVLRENKAWCQILHVLTQYLLACNYFWMFCEGAYLHTMIVITFVREETIMKFLYAIGWGLPVLLVLVYGLVRGLVPVGNTDFCWINESNYTWVIAGPVCASVVINLFFLCNIVRVLLQKMRAVNAPDPQQYRKAVRAVLILVPLFGAQYILLIYRPPQGTSGAEVFTKVYAFFASFQGLFVALIFCLLNGEVLRTIYTHVMRNILKRTDKLSARNTSVYLRPKSTANVAEQTPIHQNSQF